MEFDFKRRLNTPIHDEPIGKLLESLHMESVFFTQSSLTSPWAISMPPIHNCMMFHLVLCGEAEFCEGAFNEKLGPGDFILFPKGEGHTLGDGICRAYTPLSDLPIKAVTDRFETLTYGGLGERTQMICGVMLFQHPLAIKLLGILPTHIVIKNEEKAASNVVTKLSHLLEIETSELDVGAEAVIARLADILVVTAMRQYLSKLSEDETGWLGALEDDRIGKALTMIHDNPEHHWGLEELARNVGMSRTSFAQQFKRLVGNTPMEYLTEWRMSLAYSKLQLTKDTMLTIALDIGYQSEAAFSRAFKKVMGKTPNEIRKAYQAQVNH